MKFTTNKFALYSMISASISIVLSLIFGSVGVLFAISSIGFGVKAMVDYSRNKSLGGVLGAVTAIIIGLVFVVILGAGFLKLSSEVPGRVLTGCGPADERGNEDCYQQLALDNNDPSYCRQLSEVYNSSCLSQYSIQRNDLELCRSLLNVWPEEEGVDCLRGIAAVRGDVVLCNEIEESYAGKVYGVTMDDVDSCIRSVALDKQDSAICNLLENTRRREDCFLSTAIASLNDVACAQISDETNKNLCSSLVQTTSDNVAYIQRLDPSSLEANRAWRDLAGEWDDINYCNHITDQKIRDYCFHINLLNPHSFS